MTSDPDGNGASVEITCQEGLAKVTVRSGDGRSMWVFLLPDEARAMAKALDMPGDPATVADMGGGVTIRWIPCHTHFGRLYPEGGECPVCANAVTG